MKTLKVVSPPGPGRLSFIAATKSAKGPIMSGPGTDDYACGGCGRLLIKGLGSQVDGFLLQCTNCKKWNQA